MLQPTSLQSATVADALGYATALLRQSSPSARIDALLLVARAVDKPCEWLVAYPQARLSPEQVAAIYGACERRRGGEPIAYIVGSGWFYGRELCVNEHVLVPRPETEHLIDEALGFIHADMRVLDVGTGSGAIACTIAAATGARVDATDISPAAIDVARENARRLGVADRCRFYRSDLTESLSGERYDCVIANLPYVPTSDLAKAPDPTSFEPRVALDGGPDGLALYRRLLSQLPSLLKKRALALFECAPPTIAALAGVVSATLANFVVETHEDYANLERYVKAYTAGSGAPVPVEGRVNPSEASEGESERPQDRHGSWGQM